MFPILELILLTFTTFSFSARAFEFKLAPDWSARVGGFLSLSLIEDSKGSFNETLRDGPVHSTDSSQFLESIRYSRLSFTLIAPEFSGFDSRFYLEIDFAGAKVSQDQDFSNATFRIRHAYYLAKKSHWNFLIGQSWTLFGWNPTFFLSTVGFAPGPATLFQRTTEILGVTKRDLSTLWKIELAASLEQPSQRSANLPNLVLATKLAYAGLQAPLYSLVGDPATESLAIAFSATVKRFRAAPGPGYAENSVTSFATSTNIFFPILPLSAARGLRYLALRGSWASGTGFADALPGWTANLASTSNLDAGQGGFAADNSFHVFDLMTWNVQLQAQLSLPVDLVTNVGYGQVRARNGADLGPVAKDQVTDGPYDGIDYLFLNVMKDISSSVRFGLEYSLDVTRFLSGSDLHDDRYTGLIGYKF